MNWLDARRSQLTHQHQTRWSEDVKLLRCDPRVRVTVEYAMNEVNQLQRREDISLLWPELWQNKRLIILRLRWLSEIEPFFWSLNRQRINTSDLDWESSESSWFSYNSESLSDPSVAGSIGSVSVSESNSDSGCSHTARTWGSRGCSKDRLQSSFLN